MNNDNKEHYLYFPECKITRSYFVPNSGFSVISMYIKSLQNTPKHYPQYPILLGKVDFYFGLEIKTSFQDSLAQKYYNLFNIFLNDPPSKIVSSKISLIARFSPNETIKLNTIGIGEPQGKIILFNSHLNEDEIEQIYFSAKLNYSLPSKENKTIKKKKI